MTVQNLHEDVLFLFFLFLSCHIYDKLTVQNDDAFILKCLFSVYFPTYTMYFYLEGIFTLNTELIHYPISVSWLISGMNLTELLELLHPMKL